MDVYTLYARSVPQIDRLVRQNARDPEPSTVIEIAISSADYEDLLSEVRNQGWATAPTVNRLAGRPVVVDERLRRDQIVVRMSRFA